MQGLLASGDAANGTYFWKIPKFVALSFGSAPMAVSPAAVGARTAPPPTEMKPTGLRSKLVKKKRLFLMIGRPKVPPKRFASKRGFDVSPCCTQVWSTAFRLRFRKYS